MSLSNGASITAQLGYGACMYALATVAKDTQGGCWKKLSFTPPEQGIRTCFCNGRREILRVRYLTSTSVKATPRLRQTMNARKLCYGKN